MEINDDDVQRLQEDGLTKVQDKSLSVNYKRLLPVLFPQQNYIFQEIFAHAVNTIIHQLRLHNRRKLDLKKIAPADKLESQKSSAKKSSKQQLTKQQQQQQQAAATKQVTFKAQPKDPKMIGEYQKPKELFEIMEEKAEDDKDKKKASKRPESQKSKKDSKKGPVKQSLEEQLKQALPEPTKDEQYSRDKKSQNSSFCLEIVNDCFQKAITFGQSLALSKKVQGQYENRPVMKDVFTCLQDFEVNALDIMPKSVFVSEDLGRLIYIDKGSTLFQYDLVNGKLLKPLNIGSRVPFKFSKILDSLFDAQSDRLYVLNDKWQFEIYDIGQGQLSPIVRPTRAAPSSLSRSLVPRAQFPRRALTFLARALPGRRAGCACFLSNWTCSRSSRSRTSVSTTARFRSS